MEKLYEENPYLTQFSAVVESCVQGKKGYDVILVGRVKAVHTPYAAMDRQYVQALQALGLWEDRT